MDVLLLLIFALPVIYGIGVALRRWYRTVMAITRRDWASVPPPDWAAKRSGRDYW
jgi:hypothetical protein